MSMFADDGPDDLGTFVGDDVGPVVRAAFEELAGIPRELGDVLSRFTNRELADADPDAAEGGRARQTFRRNLARYRQGRQPKAPSLRRLRRAARRVAMDQLLRRVARQGVTVLEVVLEMVVSPKTSRNRNAEGERQRVIRGPWPISARRLREFGFFPPAYADLWDQAGDAFFRAFFDAYGLEAVEVLTCYELTLRVGTS